MRAGDVRKLAMLAAIALLLTPITHVAAATIGASPARVSFGDVLKGGYSEYQVTITTNSKEPLYGHLEIDGPVSSWISFLPNSTGFNTSIDDPRAITIIAQPPPDVQIGTYSGKLTVVGDTTAGIAGRAGSIVKSSVILPITVTTTGQQKIACTAGGFEIKDIEQESPLAIWTTVKNTGNVRFSPLITLAIWDSLQQKVVLKQELKTGEILPTRSERSFVTLKQDLGIGQYWADISMPECDSQGLVTFSVMEKGGISDKGELTELTVPGKVAVGEKVPITALFYNSGPRLVTAQFRGTIKRNSKIAELISSDMVEVESGKVEQLQAFFTADEPGTYSIAGRVAYNKKLTYEKNANFVAEGMGKEAAFPAYVTPLIIYVAIIMTAVFLIRKIRDRKRRHRF